MAHYNQNNKTDSALRTRNHQVGLEKDLIGITYGILDQIFKLLDEEDISAKQIISCLTTLSGKSENFIANIVKKPHDFVKKSKKYFKKPHQRILRNYILISRRKGKKKCLLGMQVFSAKIQVSQHIPQKIILILKINSYLTMVAFLK